jgi:hypothetical protein
MRLLRTFVCAAALVAASTFGAPPAFAAPPANDTIEGATTASLGFSEVIDTTEATTDTIDAQLNETCGAPATAASVWYTLTLAETSAVVVDVSASDYPAGILVGTGSPGALETVDCGPGGVVFTAEAGTTYYVLAIDDQSDGSGNGGSLSISFTGPPPAPTMDVTVAPRGTFDSRTGAVTISGTYTCTDAEFIEILGNVAQPAGRTHTIRASFDIVDQGTCDGSTHAWSATTVPDDGKFKGGQTVAVAFWFGCGTFECIEGSTQQTVRLTGRRN